ncbi:MAG: TfpX/TfpZ family type IV pilin accessory protein [Dokdonella sp.]|uniref:TfpX/TfpZ family type IV pilin accessory protein n=1 Tax=Dokdonella sp. TaxID=2291710 RepID=UPI003F7DE19D
MSRWKAAAIHLSISALIGSISAALIFLLWFPAPYSHAAGADRLILLLLGVDVVLGPLLTLIVYRHGKWGMRFDLAVIALLQASAFAYGMHVVLESRPVFVVGAIDRFVLVPADALDPKDLAEGREPEFRSLSWTGPRLVNALRPEAAADRSDLLSSGLAGKDIEKFPKYYATYAGHHEGLLSRAHALGALDAKPGATTAVDAWLADTGHHREDVVWLPLVGRDADMTMLLDRHDGRLLDALPIDPW